MRNIQGLGARWPGRPLSGESGLFPRERLVKDSKRKGSQPMPAVVRKLGPGVVVREKKEGQAAEHEQKLDYRPSDQVFRRQK